MTGIRNLATQAADLSLSAAGLAITVRREAGEPLAARARRAAADLADVALALDRLAPDNAAADEEPR